MNAGLYELIWCGDTSMRLDITGGSTAQGAIAQVYPRNNTNAQKFGITAATAGYYITSMTAGRATLPIGKFSGDYVRQVPVVLDDVREVWDFTQVGTQTIDGVSYPKYTIAKRGTTSYLGATTGGKLDLSSVAQYWVLMPSWLTQTGTTASNGVIGTSTSAVSTGTVLVPQTANVYIYAQGMATGKARYRRRIRTTAGVWGDWSAWKTIQGASIGDEDTSNHGWGTAWTAGDFTEDNGYYLLGGENNRELGSGGAVEFTCECAPYTTTQEGYPVYQPIYSFTRRAVGKYIVNTNEVGAIVAYDGLRIPYETDCAMGFTTGTVQVYLDDLLIGEKSETNLDQNDTVVIPWSVCSQILTDNQEVKIVLTLTTEDGIPQTTTTTKTTEYYNDDYGLEYDPTFTITNNILYIDLDDADVAGTDVYLTWGNHNELVGTYDGETVLVTAPPLGVDFAIWFLYIGEDGHPWGAYRRGFDALVDTPPIWYLDSLDFARQLRIREDVKDAPSFEIKYKPDTNSENTTDKTRPYISYGNTTEKEWSIDAALSSRWEEDVDEQLEAFEYFAEGAKAMFRDHRGFREYVAVTGAEIDRGRKNDYPIKIDMGAV